MCQYILDTDSVSLLLRNHPRIIANAEQYRFAITIVTVQEQFNGWVPLINNIKEAGDINQVVRLSELYTKLWKNVQFYQNQTILNFTPEAAEVLKQLLRENRALRKTKIQKDMRIAAIALSIGATVVTRNRRDFGQVPGLNIEDWTLS
ncbi:MAG: type II toxin-antitoxin system VapC family toxin [Limnospira sp.]